VRVPEPLVSDAMNDSSWSTITSSEGVHQAKSIPMSSLSLAFAFAVVATMMTCHFVVGDAVEPRFHHHLRSQILRDQMLLCGGLLVGGDRAGGRCRLWAS
jgi:hypothetical protein